MNAQTQPVSSSGTSSASKQEITKVATASDTVPRCCGEPMQPRFAHAHDRYGNEFFVTVWRCPRCGRLAT